MERSNTQAYACQAITDPQDFLGLEAEWDALLAAAPQSYVSDSHTWARLCWALGPDGLGRRLLCLTVRQGRALVGVLPLTVSRRAAWRVAAPLISSTEYCPFLVHPEADPEEVWRAVSATLKRANVDVLRLLNVRKDTPIGRCLALHAAPGAELYITPVLEIPRADLQDWSAYRARLSTKARGNMNRYRRLFSAAATLTFEEVTDPAARAATWRWMLEHKRTWAARNGIKSSWLFSESFERFIAAGLAVLGPTGARRLFVLKADGTLAAAALASVDRARVEGFMDAYEEAFAQYSPGSLLREDCARWASQHGLAFDMRLGGGGHKDAWRAASFEAASYFIPFSASGKLLSWGLRLASAVSEMRSRAAARPSSARPPADQDATPSGAEPAIMQGLNRPTRSSNG